MIFNDYLCNLNEFHNNIMITKTRTNTDQTMTSIANPVAESSDWNGGWRLLWEKRKSENPYCDTTVEQ